MKIIQLIVGLVTGILLMTGIVIPASTDALSTAGDPITYTNVGSGYALLTTNENLSASIYDTTITINDVEFDATSGTYWGLATDSWVIRFNGTNFDFTAGRMNGGEPYGPQIDGATITLENGNSTVVYTFENHTRSETYTSAYTWVAYPSQNGEWITVLQNSTVYVNSVKDFIFSGFYTTGNNDAYYSYYNGEATAQYSGTTYDASVTATLTPADGTTDIYTTDHPLMHVGDESFTPYVYLVKETISGHKDSGANYALLTAIPIVGMIVLLAYAAYSIRGREFD